MKLIVLLFLFIAIPSMAANLTLNIKGIKDARGQICYNVVSEYGSEVFPEIPEDDEYSFSECFDVTSRDDITLEFEVEELTYSVFLFHDVNHNNKMDKNFFGMPKEPLGLSVVSKIPLRVPKFDECSFEVDGDTIQMIKLQKMKM